MHRSILVPFALVIHCEHSRLHTKSLLERNSWTLMKPTWITVGHKSWDRGHSSCKVILVLINDTLTRYAHNPQIRHRPVEKNILSSGRIHKATYLKKSICWAIFCGREPAQSLVNVLESQPLNRDVPRHCCTKMGKESRGPTESYVSWQDYVAVWVGYQGPLVAIS
jgi:hypothetical protein